MRTYIQLIASLFVVGILTATGCSHGGSSPTSKFSGVWIGWLLPREPNTFDLTWNVWTSKGVIIMTPTKDGGMRALDEVKFTVTQEISEVDGRSGLVLQTDRGVWKILFGKNGDGFGVCDTLGQMIGGFKYVTYTSFTPEDYQGRR